MIKQKKILKNYLLYFLLMILVCIVGISNVFGATISDYATKYYYYTANDNSSTNSTVYRSGNDNFVTLFGAEAPTYDNGEGFNGFYNRINYSIVKGNIYTLNLILSYSNIQENEFNTNDVNNRILNTNFAHCSHCSISSVSGFLRRYNASSPVASNLYDYTVSISYTFVATSTVNQWYIGTYTGDDRVLGLDNHLYTSIVNITGLSIEENNSSTIINQNDTIINQNNQIIEQNNQNTQDIISNQNTNNQNIINNNNTNTNNIMNNNNENTNKEINSQNVCRVINKDYIEIDNSYLTASGEVRTSNLYGITKYFELNTSSEITVLNSQYDSIGCFYNDDKSIKSCFRFRDYNDNSTITIPNNSSYFRYMILKSSNIPVIKLCSNGNQALNDSINGLNDSLNNDNVDDNGIASAFDDFNDYLDDNSTITQLITLPITLYTAILNNVNGTCSPFNLGNLYGEDLILPCINVSQYLGSSLWSMIDIIISGFAIYAISKKMIKVFNNFSSLREGDVIDD